MKFIKTFENFEEVVTPKEFAKKYNPDYKFIVYVNGKAVSGWEYLSDAIKDGIADTYYDLFSEDMMDFEDEMDMKLGEYNIDIEDEMEDIDVDDLNQAISELSKQFDFDGNIEIRFVDSDEPTYERLDRDTYLSAADKMQYQQLQPNRAKNLRKHAHRFQDGDKLFILTDSRNKRKKYTELKTRELKFIGVMLEDSFGKRILNGGISVIFQFKSDDGISFNLPLLKEKGSDIFTKDKDHHILNKTIFTDRREALKFYDFINQDSDCIEKLGDKLSQIKVNSLYTD